DRAAVGRLLASGPVPAGPADVAEPHDWPFPRRLAAASRPRADLPAPLDRPPLRNPRTALRRAHRPRHRLLRKHSPRIGPGPSLARTPARWEVFHVCKDARRFTAPGRARPGGDAPRGESVPQLLCP